MKEETGQIIGIDLGTSFSEAAHTTADGKPIPIGMDPSNREIVAVDFSAEILRYMKSSAEAYLDRPIRRAVITVPAYFGSSKGRHDRSGQDRRL